MRYKHLGSEERHQIAAMRGLYLVIAEIARTLGRHRSTVYRELKRNRSVHDGFYRATHSSWKANGRKRRSRRNLRYGKKAFAPVEAMIRRQLSPEQIVGRCRLEGEKIMSHETIYKWIWAEKKRGGSLWMHLRGARKIKRKRYGGNDSRGRLAGKAMITERPAMVEARKRIGDWEIDTIHGRGKACVVTVVERKTGLVRLGPLPGATMEETLDRTVSILWEDRQRVLTITSDNGTEFHNYKELEAALDTKVYFATPHHAWERGTNENTNGLIRQYLCKGEALTKVTQRDCNRIAEILNNRPRRRHGFLTPNELYYDSSFVALQN